MDITRESGFQPHIQPSPPCLLSAPDSRIQGRVGCPHASHSRCSRKKVRDRFGDRDPLSLPAHCQPSCGGHVSSTAALPSSLDHPTQSLLPDLVHLKEGEETWKSTVREGSENDRNPEGARGRTETKKEVQEQGPREKERQRQKPEREKRQMKQKTGKEWTETLKRGTLRALSWAWAEGRSRPPYLLMPARGTGDCKCVREEKRPPSPHPLTQGPSSPPMACSLQTLERILPKHHPQALAVWPFYASSPERSKNISSQSFLDMCDSSARPSSSTPHLVSSQGRRQAGGQKC